MSAADIEFRRDQARQRLRAPAEPADRAVTRAFPPGGRGIAAMLAEFHDALGDEPGRRNAPLRITLHNEEHVELVEALELTEAFSDVPGVGEAAGLLEAREQVARELADVVYIAFGTAHAFDIDLDAALAEIHRAAMSKLDPATMVVREDGKILKPPGFIPPDMAEAIPCR